MNAADAHAAGFAEAVASHTPLVEEFAARALTAEAALHDSYRLLIQAARSLKMAHDWGIVPPEPGDLVVEITGWLRPVDPDGIGWLVARGPAPMNEDGTGRVREVYDVLPLNPKALLQEWGGQRWENAVFSKLPDVWLKHMNLRPPLSLFDLIETRADVGPDGEDSYYRHRSYGG